MTEEVSWADGLRRWAVDVRTQLVTADTRRALEVENAFSGNLRPRVESLVLYAELAGELHQPPRFQRTFFDDLNHASNVRCAYVSCQSPYVRDEE